MASSASAVSSPLIGLSWTDAGGNETQFKIKRCQGMSCTNFAQVATVRANTVAYTDNRLSRNATYRYRVRAAANTPILEANIQCNLFFQPTRNRH